MRISEALAFETRHFINGGCTIKVEQQVKKDCPRIVKYLKTGAAKREIDLHPDVAEFLQRYMSGKSGLLKLWWTWPGSNRRPPACKAGALPAELHAHKRIHIHSKTLSTASHCGKRGGGEIPRSMYSARNDGLGRGSSV